MRESASLASSFQRQQLPAGLMQRLEMMQQLALQAKAQADGQPFGDPVVPRRPRRGAHLIVLAWFSLGVMTSGAAGVGALLGLRALEARGTPLAWESVRASLGATLASAWAKVPPIAFKSRPAPGADGAWERVEVKIDATRRADAPLGLHVTGGDGRTVYFVLDGLPNGVRPSHGAAVGPDTWVVGSADIDSLHLTLDDGAPRAFDLKVALLAPTGVAKSGSMLEVRLVDGATPMQASSGQVGKDDTGEKGTAGEKAKADETPPTSTATMAVASAPAGSAGAPAEGKSAHEAVKSATQPATGSVRRWAEGASGLGAKSH